MALTLRLDVIRDRELAWNRSPVLVPPTLRSSVRVLRAGAVVEAECAWAAGGLTLLEAPRIVLEGESFEARVALAVERGNWESVLHLVEGQPPSARLEGWRARALLSLGRHAEFADAFARLVSMEGVDLSDELTGLWMIRQDLSDEDWERLERPLRAAAFRLAWKGLLVAPAFGDQPFADTLFPELRRLLEAVPPSARPSRLLAGGPKLLYEPEDTAVVAWCAANLGPFAPSAQWSELAPVRQILERFRASDRERLRDHRSRVGAFANVPNAVAAVQQRETAMSQLSGALALDPGNTAGVELLRRLITHTPTTLPPEVEASRRTADRQARAGVARGTALRRCLAHWWWCRPWPRPHWSRARATSVHERGLSPSWWESWSS